MSIGNVQAIRDWINTNYYSKQEIIDLFATEYRGTIYGGTNEIVTVTNTGYLGTVQTFNLSTSGYLQNIAIKALPGDTITLKGSISNQTFSHTFGLKTTGLQFYCMPKNTIYWYGNMINGTLGGNIQLVTGTGASTQPVYMVNDINANRVFFGVHNKTLSEDITYESYAPVFATYNLINFDTTGLNSVNNPRISIKGENYCPGSNGSIYKKLFKIRIGEENNNSMVTFCDGPTASAIDGVSFNINQDFSTHQNTTSIPNTKTTNFTKPYPPYRMYFFIQVMNPASETPVRNEVAISELYFK